MTVRKRKTSKQAPPRTTTTTTTRPTLPSYSWEEVKQHGRAEDCWVVVDGLVIDLTAFLAAHPGGDAPVAFAGKDATAAFYGSHKAHTREMAGRYVIGTVDSAEARAEKDLTPPSWYDPDEDPLGYDSHATLSRQFGDLMAQEGRVSNIPSIIVVLLAVLGAYAWLVSHVAGVSFWLIPTYYVLGMTAFFAWHALAHSPISGACHEIHMRHHLIHFPPKRFYGTAALFASMYPEGQPTIWSLMDIRKTSADGAGASREHWPLVHEGPMIVMMVGLLGLGYFAFGVPAAGIGAVFVMYTAMGVVGGALHFSFHVRHFHLEAYAWYRELRALHHIHHMGDMKSNLAMLNVGFDALFGSLAIHDPVLHRTSNPPPWYASPGGALTYLIGLDLPLRAVPRTTLAYARGGATLFLRAGIVAATLAAWLYAGNRAAVHASSFPSSSYQDVGHTLAAPLGAWLEGSGYAPLACGVCASLSDVAVVGIVASSIVGSSVRPLLTGAFLVGMRSLMQWLGTVSLIPLVAASSWVVPAGWPTLFVFGSPAANAFFSPRVALAAVVVLEWLANMRASRKRSNLLCAMWSRRFLSVIALAYLVGVVVLSLALKASWSFDVVLSLVIARYGFIFGERASVFVEALLP